MGQFQSRRFIFEDLWTKAAGISTSESSLRRTAKNVMLLSELYTQGNGSPDVWKNPDLENAYLAYYFPLNSVRISRALQMISLPELFEGITHVNELGSGPGTAHLTFQALNQKWPWLAIEKAKEAGQRHKKLADELGLQLPEFVEEPKNLQSSLGVFSYVLTETALPPWAFECKSLFIVEPSMRNASRSLIQVRQHLIDEGFEVLGPCTHQEGCPLLLHTSKDWCHFRVHYQKPDYFSTLESFLPMRNDSLTFSFLAARKVDSPKRIQPLTKGRVIGEVIREKGKHKIGFCRSSQREQISWLTRGHELIAPESGSIFELPEDVKNLGSEIRLPTKTKKD